ncbi:hypothetical protein [Burkholderia territorii]|uniref:hypothetical protein n=1 Tax=Burkholderia territorii TaxID=1503055 RepID=UPI0012DB4D37|nr:hypothetical protein [Burkholderia territorii]
MTSRLPVAKAAPWPRSVRDLTVVARPIGVFRLWLIRVSFLDKWARIIPHKFARTRKEDQSDESETYADCRFVGKTLLQMILFGGVREYRLTKSACRLRGERHAAAHCLSHSRYEFSRVAAAPART